MAVDTNLYMQKGETPEAYNARVETYQNSKAYNDANVKTSSSGPTAPTYISATGDGSQITRDDKGNIIPKSAPGTPATRYPTTTPTQTPVQGAQADYAQDVTPEDPAAKAARIQAEYAAEIASIQQYYGNLVSGAQKANVNTEGAVRSIQGAAGSLFSPTGVSAIKKEQEAGQARVNAIGDEMQTKIASIQSGIAAKIEEETINEKTTKTAADLARITELKTQQEEAQKKMATIAAATALKDLSQPEYDALYEAAGFANADEFNTYYESMRQSAMTGGKTIGDAKSGVYQQQQDGSWKIVIPATDAIGTPETGVWKQKDDGTYANVIPAQPKIGAIGAQGSYVFNPSSGKIDVIKPAAPKIVASGGVIYSVDPTTSKATPLTSSASQDGWSGAKGSAGNQEKAAVLSYINSLGINDDQKKQLQSAVKSNPDDYYNALAKASQAGFFIPMNIGAPTDTTASDAAANISLNADQLPSDNPVQ